MDGPKKSAKFGLLRNGEYIGVSVVLNLNTKFAKLAVGKHVVTAKQRNNSQDPLLPLSISLGDLAPLTKVQIDYEFQPKNTFIIRVNDAEFYSLVKEEVDFDPSQIETLKVMLKINDVRAISGSMPWIVDEVEEKI